MNNVAHQQRVPGCLDEARRRGAEVIEVNPADENFSTQRSRKIVPALVIDPPDDCWLMQEEIFGAVLPLRTYGTQEEVIAYSNARPRPLALYCFGDRIGAARILESTISRGAAVD